MSTPNTWQAIDAHTWLYDDGGVRFFLLEGTERALLIDSGMNTRNARDLAEAQTRLPVSLFNTHLDMDHAGSNAQFEQFLVDPAELVNCRQPLTSGQIIPVYDGDVIDLGDRPLEAIALPGHTPGSLALLDKKTGMLFSGDPIQRDGQIFMFGPLRNFPAYIHSLRRLLTRKAEITAIYPSHAACPIPPEAIDEVLAGAERIERGECPYTLHDLFGTTVRVYDVGTTRFLGENKE